MNKAVQLFLDDTLHYGQRYEECGMYVIKWSMFTNKAINYDGEIYKVWLDHADWHCKRVGDVWEMETGDEGTYTPGLHDGTYRREFYFDYNAAASDVKNVVRFFGRGNDKVF